MTLSAFIAVLSGEVGSKPSASAVVAAEVPAELAGPEIVGEPALPWPDAGLALEDDGPLAASTGQQHSVVSKTVPWVFNSVGIEQWRTKTA